MQIVDYKIMRPPLDEFNFVLAVDCEVTRKELNEMGCTSEEIRATEDGTGKCLSVWAMLHNKGYSFLPKQGRWKKTQM